MNVGFVGLGLMGGPMCKNLLKAGFTLTVNTRTPGKAELFAKENSCKSGTLQQVAESSDVIIVCVTDSPDVEAVARGEHGLLAHCRPNTVVADMSTISPKVTVQLAAEAKKRQVYWIDAPVSGGTKGAAEGTLTVMVGGEGEALRRARPVLEAMGKKITHFGGPGQGQNAKVSKRRENCVLLNLHTFRFSFAIKS
jgi:3-hydroxyisobutyrate dehydrogenase-like beta-hydroxyacid dehydrogenase